MEALLKQIIHQISSLEKKFESLDSGQQTLTNKFDSLDSGLQTLTNRADSFEVGQQSLLKEQSEMRKEIGFYYGSMMKKLDETKSELSSEIKQLPTIQKQHQSVLEIINEKL